jgi:nucleotide-binding universal stress UspA family protein
VHFEPYAVEALQYAVDAAVALGARLTALYAGDAPDTAAYLFESFIERLPPERRAACRPDLQCASGGGVQAIAKAAPAHELVVLSSHHRAILRELLLGTTAGRVVRACQTAVLAVPPHADAPERP